MTLWFNQHGVGLRLKIGGVCVDHVTAEAV